MQSAGISVFPRESFPAWGQRLGDTGFSRPGKIEGIGPGTVLQERLSRFAMSRPGPSFRLIGKLQQQSLDLSSKVFYFASVEFFRDV